MLPLPFKTTPKQEFKLVGNTFIGVLKFPVYFGLLVGEKVEIDAELNQISPFVLAAELSCKIQFDTGSTDLLLCSKVVLGGDSEAEEDVKFVSENRVKYARQIHSIQNYSETFSDSEKFATVTAICKRLVPDWNADTTKCLSDKLFDAIWEFALSEINFSAEDKPPTQLTEEDIKKPQSDRTNLQTGEISIGESKPTGEKTIALTAETLPSNHAGLSSMLYLEGNE